MHAYHLSVGYSSSKRIPLWSMLMGTARDPSATWAHASARLQAIGISLSFLCSPWNELAVQSNAQNKVQNHTIQTFKYDPFRTNRSPVLGTKPVNYLVVCPPNTTAVLKGVLKAHLTVCSGWRSFRKSIFEKKRRQTRTPKLKSFSPTPIITNNKAVLL